MNTILLLAALTALTSLSMWVESKPLVTKLFRRVVPIWFEFALTHTMNDVEIYDDLTSLTSYLCFSSRYEVVRSPCSQQVAGWAEPCWGSGSTLDTFSCVSESVWVCF